MLPTLIMIGLTGGGVIVRCFWPPVIDDYPGRWSRKQSCLIGGGILAADAVLTAVWWWLT